MISNPILPTIPEPVASFGSPFHPRPDQISTVYAFTFSSGYSMAKRTNYSAKLKISSRGLSTPTRNASPSPSQSLFLLESQLKVLWAQPLWFNRRNSDMMYKEGEARIPAHPFRFSVPKMFQVGRMNGVEKFLVPFSFFVIASVRWNEMTKNIISLPMSFPIFLLFCFSAF